MARGSTLVGGSVRSPSSWWKFAVEWGRLLQLSSFNSQESLGGLKLLPNQSGGHTFEHVQRCHGFLSSPCCTGCLCSTSWILHVPSAWSHHCTTGEILCRRPGQQLLSSSLQSPSSSSRQGTISRCWMAWGQSWPYIGVHTPSLALHWDCRLNISTISLPLQGVCPGGCHWIERLGGAGFKKRLFMTSFLGKSLAWEGMYMNSVMECILCHDV